MSEINSEVADLSGTPKQAAFSVADMSEFKPPTSFDQANSTQVAMMSGADQFANYDKQTYQGIEQMEKGHVGQFARTYLEGNERVRSELTNSLKTAGIKLESDGKSVKLSLMEDPRVSLTMSQENGITAQGASAVAIRNYMSAKVQNRPEIRGA